MRARNRLVVRSALVIVVAGLTARQVFSQDQPASATVDKDEMKRRFEEAGRPVEQHKTLASDAGKWDADVTVTKPSGETLHSKGTSTVKSILNGLYVTEEFEGDHEGKAFEGLEIRGFSKEKQRYFAVWLDSMTTTPELMWGTADSSGRVITFDGEARSCPMGDYVPRWVVRRMDDNHQTFEHWSRPVTGAAPEFKKDIEIHYTRHK